MSSKNGTVRSGNKKTATAKRTAAKKIVRKTGASSTVKAKKNATLEDALFTAWQKTYETRHKRVA